MIESAIKIGDSPIEDFLDKWGFIYLDADERTEAPIKKRDVTSYAEDAGEHADNRTVADAFDYTVKFMIETPNRYLTSANAKIEAFNKALYEQVAGTAIRRYKEVAFYNYHNRVVIVGIPEPIAVPTKFYRWDDDRAPDCAEIELKIRVTDPTKCNFNWGAIEKVCAEAGGWFALEVGGGIFME